MSSRLVRSTLDYSSRFVQVQINRSKHKNFISSFHVICLSHSKGVSRPIDYEYLEYGADDGPLVRVVRRDPESQIPDLGLDVLGSEQDLGVGGQLGIGRGRM